MSIKGKSKPKAGGKVVTRGPKPTFVPVRRPLLQRRSFWYAVLGVLVVASVVGIWYGIAKQRSSDRAENLTAAKRAAAAAYQGQVEPILAGIGETLQPSGFQAFPELASQLTAFADGTITAAELGEGAAGLATDAKRAAADFERIDAVEIVAGKGFDKAFVLYVLNAQSRMTQALQLYEQAALLAQEAAAADGEAASTLAERATAVADVASRLFADGYQDYDEARLLAGIFQPVPVVPSP